MRFTVVFNNDYIINGSPLTTKEHGMKKIVMLVVVTHMPIATDVIALLRRRGKLNPKTKMREEYPGCCEVTIKAEINCEGKNLHLSGVIDFLKVTIVEEFGSTAAEMIFEYTESLIEVYHHQDVQTFMLFMPPDFIEYVRIRGSSGGFDYVTLSEAANIEDISNYCRDAGVTKPYTIAMFPNEKRAVFNSLRAIAEEATI